MAERATYRHMGCPALVDWFLAANPDAFLSKGRDAHLLHVFLDERGVAPTQVLEGMLYRPARSVPTFLHDADRWLLSDVLAQEAELALFLSGDDPPPCYHDYSDLKDTGVLSVQIEEAYQRARQELEQWVDAALERPALNPRHPAIRKALQKRERMVGSTAG